jgi:Uma2 family endonuclease
VSTPVRRSATYEDLLKVPDHLIAEIIDGELYTSPRPSLHHAISASELAADLVPAFSRGQGGPGGWWILFEPELHLGRDILVPDLAGWRRERLPVIADDPPYSTVAPDWISEVLSPTTYRLDRIKKLRIYGREGVKHAWLLHPGERTLEVLRLESGRWTIVATHADDAVVRAEPFEAVEIDLLPLWGESRRELKPRRRAASKAKPRTADRSSRPLRSRPRR